MAASQPEYMKQAIKMPPISPFMPPMPLHENQAQENCAAALPCASAIRATAATIKITAYSNNTIAHSKRATIFNPMIASAVISKFQAAPTAKMAQWLSINEGASRSMV